jgi:hypothetical protein
VKRETSLKVLLTFVFSTALLALAVFRNNGWQTQAWKTWIVSQPKVSRPEDAIYGMLDASRTGDIKAYLDTFSGSMHDQLVQVVKENSDSRFSSYLKAQDAAFEGVAVAIIDQPNSEQAEARVEYVYQNRNEIQNIYLTKRRERWKIFKVTGVEPVKTLIPFGTAVTD